jgi:hypothetical protein
MSLHYRASCETVPVVRLAIADQSLESILRVWRKVQGMLYSRLLVYHTSANLMRFGETAR